MSQGDNVMASRSVPGSNDTMVTLLAASWLDTKIVKIISTGIGNGHKLIKKSMNNGDMQTFDCISAISMYQKYIFFGGGGGCGQERLHADGLLLVGESIFYAKVKHVNFLSLLELALTNSYILNSMVHPKGSPLYLNRSGYLCAIAEGLLFFKRIRDGAPQIDKSFLAEFHSTQVIFVALRT